MRLSRTPLKILPEGGTVGASETNLPVCVFDNDDYASRTFRLDALVSGVTVGAGISIQLQSRMDSAASYVNVPSANATASITVDGTVSILLNYTRAGDQTSMPLQQDCRLVCTTGAGSAVTFEAIYLQKS